MQRTILSTRGGGGARAGEWGAYSSFTVHRHAHNHQREGSIPIQIADCQATMAPSRKHNSCCLNSGAVIYGHWRHLMLEYCRRQHGNPAPSCNGSPTKTLGRWRDVETKCLALVLFVIVVSCEIIKRGRWWSCWRLGCLTRWWVSRPQEISGVAHWLSTRL
jgi:hypothetical protein